MPVPQFLQEFWPPWFWYWPCPQFKHEVLATAFVYLPVTQLMQLSLPPLGWNLPVLQLLHASLRWLVASSYVPEPQFPHTVFALGEHVVVRLLPAAQVLHVLQLPLLSSFW